MNKPDERASDAAERPIERWRSGANAGEAIDAPDPDRYVTEGEHHAAAPRADRGLEDPAFVNDMTRVGQRSGRPLRGWGHREEWARDTADPRSARTGESVVDEALHPPTVGTAARDDAASDPIVARGEGGTDPRAPWETQAGRRAGLRPPADLGEHTPHAYDRPMPGASPDPTRGPERRRR